MNFDDRDEPSLREIYAAEKARLEIDIAERAEQLARFEREKAANRQEQPVQKSYDEAPPTPRRSAPAQAPDWTNYINARVKSGDQRVTKILTEAVGETLADVRKQLRAEFDAKLEAEVAKIRIEFLQQQLDATRNVARLKSVPPAQIA